MNKKNGPEKHAVSWLKATGPESDVVVSSRLRLARNLANHPFLPRLATAEREGLIQQIEKAIQGSNFLKKTNLYN